MSGKTHLAMGVASALVIIRPMTLSDLIVCTGAAIIGSLICDIDIKTSNSRSAFNTILGIIVILSIIEGYINYRFNFSIMTMILEESNMYRLLSGIAVFIVTCIVCKEFPHRTFTHSALGVLLFSLIVFYIFPDMMMPFAVAMVSHIVLDMMNKKAVPTAAAVRELAILTGAVAIIAAAVYFFLVPSHASVSSISGLGIVLANFVPLPLSAITMILNVVLLVIGFLTCGREFGAKTVYTSILLPAFIGLFERLFPNLGSLTDSQELDVLCYILVVSVGLSILFNRNASSGGLDIVAKIMNKYLHMDLGKAMSLSGICVALSAALVYDKKTVVLSVLGTYFNGLVLDHFIFDQNIKRRVCIITGKEEELRRFIIEDLHSGATVYESYGAYNMQKRREIITIVDKAEYQKLMSYMNREDPQAFITVYTVSDMRYQPKGNTA
jgi:uncharacterized membrane-anchored protein YitT (DUF2179 family)/membrane-bound metal-dependent hydrolase YbcI (DUF457 family)